jgi:hypothetical protein
MRLLKLSLLLAVVSIQVLAYPGKSKDKEKPEDSKPSTTSTASSPPVQTGKVVITKQGINQTDIALGAVDNGNEEEVTLDEIKKILDSNTGEKPSSDSDAKAFIEACGGKGDKLSKTEFMHCVGGDMSELAGGN